MTRRKTQPRNSKRAAAIDEHEAETLANCYSLLLASIRRNRAEREAAEHKQPKDDNAREREP